MSDSQKSILGLGRIDALTVFDGDHIAALVKALTDRDDEVRLLAVEVLGELGGKAEGG